MEVTPKLLEDYKGHGESRRNSNFRSLNRVPATNSFAPPAPDPYVSRELPQAEGDALPRVLSEL